MCHYTDCEACPGLDPGEPEGAGLSRGGWEMEMKLLKETYKTFDGARKRAGFENGVARSEYINGYKAKMYRYQVVPMEDGTWKVSREVVKA